MLHHIDRLYDIAHKEERIIIGLMSGTSMDGLDIALCRVKGSGKGTKVKLVHFDTFPYPDEFKNEIRKVFSKQTVDLRYLCALNPKTGVFHASCVNTCLKRWGLNAQDIDLIASHGQTIIHAPIRLHQIKGFPDSTLQTGDGDHIASNTGIITISDFRQKHLAHGGEGAPLAVYGDYLLFSSPVEDRVLLNIGGMANITYLPAGGNLTDCLVTDTGPGNTLLDAWVQKHFGIEFDSDGKLARSGSVNVKLFKELKLHPFFKASIPKSTGPEDFNLNYVVESIMKSSQQDVSHQDILSTLSYLTASTIAEIILKVDAKHKANIYISGGGIHNSFLMEQIKEKLPSKLIESTDKFGINGDAKEAVLFALLANECVSGVKNKTLPTNPAVPDISMGKISFPD